MWYCAIVLDGDLGHGGNFDALAAWFALLCGDGEEFHFFLPCGDPGDYIGAFTEVKHCGTLGEGLFAFGCGLGEVFAGDGHCLELVFQGENHQVAPLFDFRFLLCQLYWGVALA